MAVAIAVKVRFFARLRELAGLEAESMAIAPGSTLGQLYASLKQKHPALAADPAPVRGAINAEFASWDAVVSDGDEVAFIPPVSGGL